MFSSPCCAANSANAGNASKYKQKIADSKPSFSCLNYTGHQYAENLNIRCYIDGI